MDSSAPTINRLLAAAESNPYLRWRSAHFARISFSEKSNQAPPEALLQQVWLYQRLLQDRLQTTDGRKVRVLHPGFWNRAAGPDFRQAVIQIGTEPPATGDVEIDLVPSGWKQHAHAGNPSYRNVILHVTWEPESAPANLPSLSLKHALDSTLPEISFWLGLEPKPAPEGLAGKCSAPLRSLSEASVTRILRQAAQARLLQKAEHLQARARQVGWDGALLEGLFGALGYKRNVWPMRGVGVLLPMLRSGLPSDAGSILAMQARILGVGGLMPSQALPGEAGEYLRQVWSIWWRESDAFREFQFPREIWNLGGIRPANHPERRLAAAAHWAVRTEMTREFDRWLERKIESPDLSTSLSEIVQVRQDPFWSYHWTLKSKPFRESQPLLGEQRITDLAINVILPWLYVRALAGQNEMLSRVAEARYFQWPAGDDNSVLKLARQRLFGGVSSRFLKTAALQQGLLQITRDFCDHSDASCNGCEFPELLSAIVANPQP